MSLQTYNKDHVTDDLSDWPLYHLDDEGRPVKTASDLPFYPGDTVCHVRRDGTGYGIVVAVTQDEISVLWSEEPAPDTFANTVFPVVKRVTPVLVTSQLVSIQPMTAPLGALFYVDYAYGSSHLGPPACSCPSASGQMGPTVGRQNNREPSNKVAIGQRRKYSGPSVRGPRKMIRLIS